MKLKKQNGFTLIELIVVLILIGIVASIAMPSYSHLINKQNIDSASEDINELIKYAKLESKYRGKIIIICPATIKVNGDLNSCSTSWNHANGMLAYYQDNNDILMKNLVYKREHDIKYTTINSKILLKVIVFEKKPNIADITKEDASFNNPMFLMFPNNTFNIVKNYGKSENLLGESGYHAKIIVAIKNNNNFCKTILINNFGSSKICSKDDEKNIPNCKCKE